MADMQHNNSSSSLSSSNDNNDPQHATATATATSTTTAPQSIQLFPKFTQLPTEIKLAIVFHATSDSMHADRSIRRAYRLLLPSLAHIEPSGRPFRLGARDLITMHFRHETQYISHAYSQTQYSGLLSTAAGPRTDGGDQWFQHYAAAQNIWAQTNVGDDPNMHLYLRHLSYVSRQCSRILASITRFVGAMPRASEAQSYTSLLLLWRFLGGEPNPSSPNSFATKFAFLSTVNLADLQAADAFLDQLVANIAFRYRDKAPLAQGPDWRFAQLYGKDRAGHASTLRTPAVPWKRFARSWALIWALKHWFLSLTAGEWVEFWCLCESAPVVAAQDRDWMAKAQSVASDETLFGEVVEDGEGEERVVLVPWLERHVMVRLSMNEWVCRNRLRAWHRAVSERLGVWIEGGAPGNRFRIDGVAGPRPEEMTPFRADLRVNVFEGFEFDLWREDEEDGLGLEELFLGP